MSPATKARLRSILGEEWTLYGHKPYCSCDGCWTWRPHIDTLKRINSYPLELYRRWWEGPLVVFLASVVLGFVLELVWKL